DLPRLGLGDRPAFGDLHEVAVVELAAIDMRVVLLRASDRLAHHWIAHAPLDANHHGLLHLGAGHPADQLALVLDRGGPFGRGGSVHLEAFSFMMVLTRAIARLVFFSWLVLPSCWVATCMRRPNWA